MRAILPPCPDCRNTARWTSTWRSAGVEPPPCGRCGDFGVLMDVRIDPKVRQIIMAWRDEPRWHRDARWRAERAGRRGFFQPRGDPVAAALAEAIAQVGPPTRPVA
jgi:hypothetical protein